MTRSGSRECQRAEWEALRSGYELILLDLGCGDGSHVRRFAIEHPDWLVLGLDTDRDALRGAAQRCARRPERGGAPNTLFVAADAAHPPPELTGVAARLTTHFPWAALLRLILEDAGSFVGLLSQLAADACEFKLVLNAAAAPEGLERPTPESVGDALRLPLAAAGFEIRSCDWLDVADAPRTRWAGRLVKGSGRAMVGLSASRSG